MSQRKTTILIIFIIFLLGSAIRLYSLNQPSLYSDETVGHYLLNTVEIERSATAPFGFISILFWRSYSLTWLFGYSVLGVRLLSAIYGALIPLSMCLIASVLNKNRRSTILITALLAAFLPWGFMISRIGYSNIPLIANLLLIHVYFFLKARTIRGYLISLPFLLIALPYYQSMVIIVPIIGSYVFLAMWRIATKTERKIILVAAVVLTALILKPIAGRFRLLSQSGRGLDLVIWRDVNTTYDTNQYRGLSWNSEPSLFSFNLPPEQLVNKLFLNRVTANLAIFAKNYLSFFSPEWLFLKGDPILRHSTGMVGAFYPFLIPFMLYGAFRFFRTADPKTRNLFLVWILVSPIPAAITKDGAGYLLRAVTLLPFLTYFCASGIVDSFKLFGKRARLTYGLALGLVALYSAWFFFYGYFHVYPALSARSYEYGFKELSDYQVAHNGASMLIVWDGYYHHGDFRFWQKTPYDQLKAFKLNQLVIGETTFWQTFPNLYFAAPKDTRNVQQFIKDYKPAYLVLPDRYFVKYSDELLKLTLEKVYELPYPDKTTAFTIYTLK